MKDAGIALIVVDVQKDFWRPYSAVPRFGALPGNLRDLLSFARKNKLFVVHTQAYFRRDRGDWMLFYRPQGRGDVPCIEGTGGAEFEGFAAPFQGEPVFRKQTFDGFVGTRLGEALEDRGIKSALIAGLETSVCVLFTATSAYLRRIVPVVVSDACADEPERHDAALRMYGGLSFLTATTAQIRDDWGGLVGKIGSFIKN